MTRRRKSTIIIWTTSPVFIHRIFTLFLGSPQEEFPKKHVKVLDSIPAIQQDSTKNEHVMNAFILCRQDSSYSRRCKSESFHTAQRGP